MPMSPFSEVGFKKFFDSHLSNYIGKLKMITWNWFDTDCKNEWGIFTRLISLTGPFAASTELSFCCCYDILAPQRAIQDDLVINKQDLVKDKLLLFNAPFQLENRKDKI